ncbi:YncE family protein [Actinoplanes sp. URMC 104]|uniref:YncE family protein n=1 Tax=Actinoplanes sp. URMC 104 TaxID=3423409 RepID=UPI003F1D0977
MTTRRSFLTLSGGVLAASALAGCREPKPAAAGPAPVPEVLLAGSRNGVVRLSGGETRPIGARSAASRDGRAVYVADDDGLRRLDAATGASLQEHKFGGGWVPRVVAESGDACVLATTPATEPPTGRTTSSLLVTTGSLPQKFHLPGCVEPDAFTSDRTGLFVLDWLPAGKPDHYRVRLLDFADGKLYPLLTRDKQAVPAGAEERMRGRGRQAVHSPDRQTLYTLYTHQPEHQHTRNLLGGTRSHVHAFVHVLHLTERWAYCLDLPDPFGHGPAEGHALAADGQHIVVLDTASGSLAYAGAATMAIERVVRIPAGGGLASLALGPDGRVYAAAGSTVSVLDRGDDRVLDTWTLPSPARGLRLGRALAAGGGTSPGGRRFLYAGGDDEVVWLDAASGRLAGRARVEGLTELLSVL